jgi:outer membrane lipase/esterase
MSHLIGTLILLLSLNINAMSMYVVGDSLSDTGNIFYALGGATTNPPYTELIPSAAYSNGRLSNGPVWAERLAENLGIDLQASLIGGTGYAYGGARTGPLTGITPSGIPTLTQQAQTITDLSGTLSADDLFVVWGGGNDIRDAAFTGNPVQALDIVQGSLFNISSVITSLANEGATRFLVPNLPDLGLMPAVQLAGPLATGFISQLTGSFNDNLTSIVLPGLELDLGIDIIDLDIESLVDEIIFDPANFGFTNVTDACIQIGGDACSNPEEYLFWDGIHPTAAGHLIIADAAYASIVPIPAAFPFFIAAISMLGLYSRHKEAL